MNLVRDIFSAYKSPRTSMRRQLAAGIREEQSLLYVMLFGLMNFISQWPQLAKKSHLEDQLLADLTAAQFVASVFMMPLLMYIIALGVGYLLHLFKRNAGFSETRRALFWAALVCVPFVLLMGAVTVFADRSVILAVSIVTLIVFIWQWISCHIEIEASHAT